MLALRARVDGVEESVMGALIAATAELRATTARHAPLAHGNGSQRRAPDALAGSPWQLLAEQWPRTARVLASLITPMESQALQFAQLAAVGGSHTWIHWLAVAYVLTYFLYLWGLHPPHLGQRQQR